MKNSKLRMISPERRLHIKIAGLIILILGIALFVALFLLHSFWIFILGAAVLVLLGLILIGSPEALVIVVEAISWLP